MDKIRIIHVLDHFDVGGLQNGVVSLLNGLDPDLFEQRVCGITRVGGSRERVTQPGVAYYDMKKGPGHDPRMPLRLAHLFWRERPHIVHTRNWGAMDGIFGARLAGVPAVVHSEHGRDQFNMRGEGRKRVWLRRLMFRLSDRVFTVSDELRSFFHRQTGYPLGRLGVLPNGVDLDRFVGREDDGAALRRELGLAEGAFVAGTVGRLDPVKDQMTLLRAAAALRARGRQVNVLVAGDGPRRAELADFVRAEGLIPQVRLLGHRADTERLLAAVDVFVLPSLSEGMSNTILEAMAAARPVVATRVGGNPQLIKDGCSGLLFAPGDVQALADRLERLQDQPGDREALGLAARRRAEAEFSLPRMIGRYTDLYLGLARQKGFGVSAGDSRFVAT